MAVRQRRFRPMAHRRRRAGFSGLGVLLFLLIATGAVRATGLPWPSAGPGPASALAAVKPPSPTPARLAAATPEVTPAVTLAPTPAATPAVTPTPEPTAAPAPDPTSLVWLPSGSGKVTVVNMPAPWIGGSKQTTDVSIYTPPGYDPTGNQLYPVIYEAPTGLALWDGETGTIAELNSLIGSGRIPAAIVVFIDESGAPMMPTECIDSYNKQQWLETFISKTVVDYVDLNYRTISDPKARTIMGHSEGGFCAAMLALRHPDVFSVDISFSGYYWAGTPAPDAAVPYGGQDSLLDAYSPALLAPEMAGVFRSSVYFILVSKANQPYFGPQFTAFEKILDAGGWGYVATDSKYPHGWAQVSNELAGALHSWAAHLMLAGV